MRPLSVVLATCNGERFLWEQLQSLQPQLEWTEEIVISDDGSTDSTLAVVERFAGIVAGETKVRVLRHTSTGSASENFRFALMHTTGSWIAFCDQDDIWLPNKLPVMLSQAQRWGAAAVGCSYEVIDESGLTEGIVRWVRQPKLVRRLQRPLLEYVLGCCQIVSRPVVDALLRDWPSRPNGQAEFHDFATVMVARHLGGLLLLPQPLVRYRRHGRNVSDHYALDKGYEASMRARTGADSYRAASRLAASRAEWWRRQSTSSSLQAARDWERRSMTLMHRAKIYDTPRRARLFVLVRELLRGTYGPTSSGRLGLRSLAGDALHWLRDRA
ncbi:MAG: glycosyltransferase [Fimbriimonadaceae bacterium]